MSKSKDSYSLGEGHGGNTPNLGRIREITETRPDLIVALEPGTRAYRMGKPLIFISPPCNGKGWHMSISCRDRYPTWDEVAKAWYDLVPDADQRTAAMVLPPPRGLYQYPQFLLSGSRDRATA